MRCSWKKTAMKGEAFSFDMKRNAQTVTCFFNPPLLRVDAKTGERPSPFRWRRGEKDRTGARGGDGGEGS